MGWVNLHSTGGFEMQGQDPLTLRLRNTKIIFLRIMENLLFEPNWSFLQGQKSSRRPKKVSDLQPRELLFVSLCPKSREQAV